MSKRLSGMAVDEQKVTSCITNLHMGCDVMDSGHDLPVTCDVIPSV